MQHRCGNIQQFKWMILNKFVCNYKYTSAKKNNTYNAWFSM